MSLIEWVVDPTYSSMNFCIPHLAIAKVRGRFTQWTGALLMSEDGYTDASVELHIEAASLDSNETHRDAEARSSSFLDVEQYPEIFFKSTGVEAANDDGLTVTGDLTLHGTTKSVKVNSKYVGRARDHNGCERIGWEASLKVSRSEFDLLWHPALENAAGFIIGDEIEISCDVEFVQAGCCDPSAENGAKKGIAP